MAGTHSPPKLGGDAVAQRRLGRSVQRRTVPINKVRFAGIYKEPLRGTLNRPPRLRLRRNHPSLLRSFLTCRNRANNKKELTHAPVWSMISGRKGIRQR